MTLKDFHSSFVSDLKEHYPFTEIQSFFTILMEEYLSLERVYLITHPDFEIVPEKLTLLQSATKRLCQQEPIQYIVGKTEFYSFPFFVKASVLIPRPETEELVAWILEERDTRTEALLTILDIGTGSGCIPISLKKHLPKAAISAIDVSKEALTIAQKNAIQNAVEITFEERDILTTDNLDQKFDIIVSNPPYVRELEKIDMKENVLNYEPQLALFVTNNDPLIFYRKIAQLAKAHLKEDGRLFFEINQYLGQETINLLYSLGFQKVLLKKDLFGNDRMIRASLS